MEKKIRIELSLEELNEVYYVFAKTYLDKPYKLDEFIAYCDNLLTNPPVYPIINKIIPKLRDYQIECIKRIKETKKNIILNKIIN